MKQIRKTDPNQEERFQEWLTERVNTVDDWEIRLVFISLLAKLEVPPSELPDQILKRMRELIVLCYPEAYGEFGASDGHIHGLADVLMDGSEPSDSTPRS